MTIENVFKICILSLYIYLAIYLVRKSSRLIKQFY